MTIFTQNLKQTEMNVHTEVQLLKDEVRYEGGVVLDEQYVVYEEDGYITAGIRVWENGPY